MAEKAMTYTEERMYSKCMEFAKASAERACAKMRADGRCLNTESFAIVNQWVCLWNAYCRGKATEEDITRLRAILRETDDAVANQDFVAFYKADNGFHELPYAIAGHPEVFKWISDVTTPLDRFRYLRTITEELPWKRTQNEHRVIVNAIAAHDASKVVDSVMDHLDPMLNDREKIVSRFPQYFENA